MSDVDDFKIDLRLLNLPELNQNLEGKLNKGLDDDTDLDTEVDTGFEEPFPPRFKFASNKSFPYEDIEDDIKQEQEKSMSQGTPQLNEYDYLSKFLDSERTTVFWNGDLDSFNSTKYLKKLGNINDSSDNNIIFMKSIENLLKETCDKKKSKINKEALLRKELSTIMDKDGNHSGFDIIGHYIAVYFDDLKVRLRNLKFESDRTTRLKIMGDNYKNEFLLEFVPLFYHYSFNNTINHILSHSNSTPEDNKSKLKEFRNDLRSGIFKIIRNILKISNKNPKNNKELEVYNVDSHAHKAIKILSDYNSKYKTEIFKLLNEIEIDEKVKTIYSETLSTLVCILEDFDLYKDGDRNKYIENLSNIFLIGAASGEKNLNKKINKIFSLDKLIEDDKKTDGDDFLLKEFYKDIELQNDESKLDDYYKIIQNEQNDLDSNFNSLTELILNSLNKDTSTISSQSRNISKAIKKAYIYITKIKTLHFPITTINKKDGENDDYNIVLSKNFIHRFNKVNEGTRKECSKEILNLKFIIQYHEIIQEALNNDNITNNINISLLKLSDYSLISDNERFYDSKNYPMLVKKYPGLDNYPDHTINFEKIGGATENFYDERRWTQINEKYIHVDDFCIIIKIIEKILNNIFKWKSIENTSGPHIALIENIKGIIFNIKNLNDQSWSWNDLEQNCGWIQGGWNSSPDDIIEKIIKVVNSLDTASKEEFYDEFKTVYKEFSQSFDTFKRKIEEIEQSGGASGTTFSSKSFNSELKEFSGRIKFIKDSIKRLDTKKLDIKKDKSPDSNKPSRQGPGKNGGPSRDPFSTPDETPVDKTSNPTQKNNEIYKIIEEYRNAYSEINNSIYKKEFKCDEYNYLIKNYNKYQAKIYSLDLENNVQQSSLDRLYSAKEKLSEIIRRCNLAKRKKSSSSSSGSSSSSSSSSGIGVPSVRSSSENVKSPDRLDRDKKQQRLSNEGKLEAGTDGKPIMKRSEKPILGSDGKPLLGPDGKPILGPDGKPLVSSKKELIIDQFGKPVIGPDGKPMYKIEKKSTDEVFDELDVTKRGKITKEEFEKLAEIKDKLKMEKFDPNNPLKTYGALFKELDKNKDGFLDKEEFREIVKKGPLPSKEESDRMKKRNMLFKMRQKQKKEKDEGILTVVTDIFDDDEKEAKEEDDFYGPITKEDIDDVERIISKYNNISQDYEDLLFENEKLSKSAELKQGVGLKLIVKKEKELNELKETTAMMIKAMEKTTNKLKESCQKKITAGKLVKSDKLSEEDLKSREAFEYYKGQVNKEFSHQKNQFHNKIKDLKEQAQKKKEVVKEEIRDEVEGEIKKNAKKLINKELREAKEQIKDKDKNTKKTKSKKEKKKRTSRKPRQNNDKKEAKSRTRRNSENKIRRTSRKPRQRRKKNSK